MKNPGHVKAFATLRKDDAMIVAVIRFGRIAMLMAFARMLKANTSEMTTQLPGPKPDEKNARYVAKDPINTILASGLSPSMVALTTWNAREDLRVKKTRWKRNARARSSHTYNKGSS
mmetsp:Transcript_18759/g.43764  ORF Transcript_18759/g.43764 Transcript_18759/m.43764 type:complete len:117 (-) Transcript_18759:1294-1644(-)